MTQAARREGPVRGERYAQTVTVPAFSRLTSYSRRGREAVPPGVRRGAVTGYGIMPAPVRPMRGTHRQSPIARVQCSASTAPYPPASTNPRKPREGGFSAITPGEVPCQARLRRRGHPHQFDARCRACGCVWKPAHLPPATPWLKRSARHRARWCTTTRQPPSMAANSSRSHRSGGRSRHGPGGSHDGCRTRRGRVVRAPVRRAHDNSVLVGAGVVVRIVLGEGDPTPPATGRPFTTPLPHQRQPPPPLLHGVGGGTPMRRRHIRRIRLRRQRPTAHRAQVMGIHARSVRDEHGKGARTTEVVRAPSRSSRGATRLSSQQGLTC